MPLGTRYGPARSASSSSAPGSRRYLLEAAASSCCGVRLRQLTASVGPRQLAVRGFIPQLGEFRRLGDHLVQGVDGEHSEVCGKLRHWSRGSVVRARSFAVRVLCDDQGCRGHGSLGVGGFQLVCRVGGAFERAADHGLAVAHGCLIQVAGRVPARGQERFTVDPAQPLGRAGSTGDWQRSRRLRTVEAVFAWPIQCSWNSDWAWLRLYLATSVPSVTPASSASRVWMPSQTRASMFSSVSWCHAV